MSPVQLGDAVVVGGVAESSGGGGGGGGGGLAAQWNELESRLEKESQRQRGGACSLCMQCMLYVWSVSVVWCVCVYCVCVCCVRVCSVRVGACVVCGMR